MRRLPGVISSEVGYTGGTTSAANYDIVKAGRSGHAEAVQVAFDPSKLSYEDLLLHFFRLHDPTTANRQARARFDRRRAINKRPTPARQ